MLQCLPALRRGNSQCNRWSVKFLRLNRSQALSSGCPSPVRRHGIETLRVAPAIRGVCPTRLPYVTIDIASHK